MSAARTDTEAAVPVGRNEERALRHQSAALLGSLIHPVRARFLLVATMVVVAQFTGVVGPALIAWAVDTALPALVGGDTRPTVLVSGAYLAAGLATGVLTFAFERQSSVLGQRMLLDLRQRVFRHTQRLDLEFHERYTSGRIIARQTNDMDTLRDLLEGGVQVVVGSTLTMVLTAASILAMDAPTAGMMLLMLLPGVALTVWFQKRSREAYRHIRTQSARLIVKFSETFTGIRAVQAFRDEERSGGEYAAIADDYRDATQRSVMVFGIYQPALRLLGNATVAVVLLVGGFRVIGGSMSVGLLLALVLYSRRFFQPIDDIAGFYNTLQSSSAALEKISQLLAEAPRVQEPTAPVPLPRSSGLIDFRDVTFRYSTDGPEVLHRTTLHVPAGQTLALVGRTGAGKSTIAKLIARFYDPTTGQVLLDGVDLRDLSSRDLRRAVVMVTQEAYLFSGTVGENIALGRPGATGEEIRAAARAVGADEFISRMPAGYDTDVNRRGGRVSAGQRQLISFARAFLADPGVLILDEATSSLDLPSERQVQEGLTSLLGRRTAVIIAHRLSTVMIADRVLVVDDGRIVEDGAPRELIARGGRFAALHEAWQASLRDGSGWSGDVPD